MRKRTPDRSGTPPTKLGAGHRRKARSAEEYKRIAGKGPKIQFKIIAVETQYFASNNNQNKIIDVET